MVYDCFSFFNEIELLKIRLSEHNSFVDKFIIIEMDSTHSGIPKPQNFNIEDFAEYKNKIDYSFISLSLLDQNHHLISYGKSNNVQESENWERENFQRNYSKEILKKYKIEGSDVILYSDLDEIINKSTFENAIDSLNNLNKCPTTNLPIAKIKQRHRYIKFNLCSDSFGFGPRILPYALYKAIDPSLFREYNLGFEACEGGWHFSYLSANSENVFNKIKSFSHAHQQNDVTNTSEAVSKVMRMVAYKEETLENLPDIVKNNSEYYFPYICYDKEL